MKTLHVCILIVLATTACQSSDLGAAGDVDSSAKLTSRADEPHIADLVGRWRRVGTYCGVDITDRKSATYTPASYVSYAEFDGSEMTIQMAAAGCSMGDYEKYQYSVGADKLSLKKTYQFSGCGNLTPTSDTWADFAMVTEAEGRVMNRWTNVACAPGKYYIDAYQKQ